MAAGSSVIQANTTTGLDIADSYKWMGKCTSPQKQPSDCNYNDEMSQGFSCKLVDTAATTSASHHFTRDLNSCKAPGGFAGDQNGQFRIPSRITADLKTGELFVADRPRSVATGVEEPRIQKFSEQGFFVEDFISTLSRAYLSNDPELLTDQTAGFFDSGIVNAIAKANNFFYVSDERKLHFFDTDPFTAAIWFDNDTGSGVEGFAFANATYQYFIEEGTDSFQYSVTDGFDTSPPGTVFLTIDDIDCDDDGLQNSLDLEPGDCDNNIQALAIEEEPDGIIFYDGTNNENDGVTFGVINATENAANLHPIRVINLPPPEGVLIESDVANDLDSPVTIAMCGNVFEFEIEPERSQLSLG